MQTLIINGSPRINGDTEMDNQANIRAKSNVSS